MREQTYISLSSLAMDLKRVALGKYQGSHSMADRFLTEALERKNEINYEEIDPYIKQILESIEKLKEEKDSQKLAEDALMFSTIIQNYSLVSRLPY